MTDVGIGLNDRKQMMPNIFGQTGIVSADDTVCFKERCSEFEQHTLPHQNHSWSMLGDN